MGQNRYGRVLVDKSVFISFFAIDKNAVISRSGVIVSTIPVSKRSAICRIIITFMILLLV
ncbi:MAG: hypothetical protein ACTSQR_08010 [Promethearchaeota archaeon]